MIGWARVEWSDVRVGDSISLFCGHNPQEVMPPKKNNAEPPRWYSKARGVEVVTLRGPRFPTGEPGEAEVEWDLVTDQPAWRPL